MKIAKVGASLLFSTHAPAIFTAVHLSELRESGFQRYPPVAIAARPVLPIRKPPEVLRVFACRSCHAEESARCASRCELSIHPAQVVPARKGDKSGPQSRL